MKTTTQLPFKQNWIGPIDNRGKSIRLKWGNSVVSELKFSQGKKLAITPYGLIGICPVGCRYCQTVRPNKKTSVFQVTGLKILGRVGTHFFKLFFSGKNIILCILKGETPEKNLGFTSKFR